MSENPLVSVIILNYNAGKLLLDCVQSVYASSYQNFEVIVVDNVSTDNSHKICKNNFENIKLIENKENLGYCEGNNVGIRSSMGEYIVILNPDTLVEPDWLEKFLDATKQFARYARFRCKKLSHATRALDTNTLGVALLRGAPSTFRSMSYFFVRALKV